MECLEVVGEDSQSRCLECIYENYEDSNNVYQEIMLCPKKVVYEQKVKDILTGVEEEQDDDAGSYSGGSGDEYKPPTLDEQHEREQQTINQGRRSKRIADKKNISTKPRTESHAPAKKRKGTENPREKKNKKKPAPASFAASSRRTRTTTTTTTKKVTSILNNDTRGKLERNLSTLSRKHKELYVEPSKEGDPKFRTYFLAINEIEPNQRGTEETAKEKRRDIPQVLICPLTNHEGDTGALASVLKSFGLPKKERKKKFSLVCKDDVEKLMDGMRSGEGLKQKEEMKQLWAKRKKEEEEEDGESD